ncbi:hypothetical protein [Sphingopyxis sp. GW247-27LB]|jgi:hypothetical protein|uniref:hypothetical protein n=1 Tax=Sphingopyxis sp. GW247-27LB TaxID=2012632 RepID=UPI000BA67FAE|nr:hypothetical protein [Sphingopyxis sp. GW247-27LB]PAL25579.1 hypothetical protein CD928_03665 [Sphingopyxis sp. GW247-27LB]
MASTFIRSLVATVVGIVVAFALILLAQYAGGELSPEAYDPVTGEILIPAGATVALIVGWFAGAFAGGWVAMRVSGRAGPGWVVAGAVIGAGLYRAVTLADAWWVMALGVLVPLAAAWAAQRTTSLAAN